MKTAIQPCLKYRRSRQPREGELWAPVSDVEKLPARIFGLTRRRCSVTGAIAQVLLVLIWAISLSAQQQECPDIPLPTLNAPTEKICHTAHIILYDTTNRIPRLVAYELTPERTLGCLPRQSKFHAEGPSAKPGEYKKLRVRLGPYDAGRRLRTLFPRLVPQPEGHAPRVCEALRDSLNLLSLRNVTRLTARTRCEEYHSSHLQKAPSCPLRRTYSQTTRGESCVK